MKKTFAVYKIFFIILLEGLFMGVSGQGFSVNKFKVNGTAHSNIAPLLYDSTLIFASNKRTSIFKSYFNSDGEYIYRLFKAKIIGGKAQNSASLFLPNEMGKFNVGSIVISADGNTMIVCQNGSDQLKNTNGKRGNTYALYFSEKSLDGSWSWLKPLPINTKKLYNVIHPSLSEDGNTLAFASDISDGKGKFDIYLSKKVNGLWQEPTNIGSNINTEFNELYPFFVGNRKLYFSSDRISGLGGMDIYKSEFQNEWSKPILLERPINSSYNDFSCYISQDEQSGYFASDRASKDEIYFFASIFPVFEDAQPQVIDTFCFEFSELTASFDSVPQPVTYRWDFGDGGSANGLEVEHCFVGPGQYKVFLNVIDLVTKQKLNSVANYDLEIDYTQQVFITCPDTVKVGQEITINATNSKLGTIIAKNYYWVIDNTERRIGEEIHFVFDKKGIFTILCGVVSSENPNERMASTRIIVVE